MAKRKRKYKSPITEFNAKVGSSKGLMKISVNRTLRGYPGSVPVVLLLPNGGERKRLSLPFSIEPVPN